MASSQTEQNTEELIKKTAREVFMTKGLDGARMQDIADKAGINKALLHYYFRSKEKLFEIIFDEQRLQFLAYIGQILQSDLTIFEKIEAVVEKQIDNLINCPHLPNFILNEITKRPDIALQKLEESGFKKILDEFFKEVNREVKKGTIKNITGEQLLMNVFSLDVFPFAGKQFFMKLFNWNDEQYMKAMHKRKKEVVQFVINSIKA